MTRSEFSIALQKLESLGFHTAGTLFHDRLFILFGKDGSDTVDLSEFLQGIVVILAGTPEQKMSLTFRAYDLDGNGYITHDELTKMFRDAWLTGIDELSQEELGSISNGSVSGSSFPLCSDLMDFATQLAKRFPDKSFDALNTNHDGKLSLSEFCTFARQDPELLVTLNGFGKQVALTFMARGGAE